MPVDVVFQLHLSTKDPREAVEETVALVRANATGLESLQIDLGLISTSNQEVLVRLAERLPSAALGFRNLGSDHAQTADQFKAQAASGFCTFNGNLTEQLPATDAFAVIEQLLESPSQAIRSTAFNLNVRNIHWKGSPPDGSGSLNLFDLKDLQKSRKILVVGNSAVLRRRTKIA